MASSRFVRAASTDRPEQSPGSIRSERWTVARVLVIALAVPGPMRAATGTAFSGSRTGGFWSGGGMACSMLVPRAESWFIRCF